MQSRALQSDTGSLIDASPASSLSSATPASNATKDPTTAELPHR